jgi:hypothetical protein
VNSKKLAFVVTLICCLTGLPAALAAGPVDGEVGVYYWLGEVDAVESTEDAEGPGIRGELWFFKYFGASAEIFELDIADETMDLMNLDIYWRPISPTENTFLALGAGWTDIEIAGVKTSGPRVSAQGRVGFAGLAYAYGRLSYFPSLDDLESSGFLVGIDVDGHEYDLGFGLEPLPFLSLWAGYRVHTLNYSVGMLDREVKTDGFYLGAGIHF